MIINREREVSHIPFKLKTTVCDIEDILKHLGNYNIYRDISVVLADLKSLVTKITYLL